MKYSASSWIVLSGVLMLLVSVLLVSLFMSLGGILSNYISIIPVFIILGLAFVVVGALINEK
ncbi:MAG: hypothetical protein KGD68_10060 [Candidatus Lokiarchaeota archaeon]|nr:hypothetical protein [Candidatus Lokiarchaeota archaeon]